MSDNCIIVLSSGNDDEYQEKITAAQQYMDSGQYTEAINMYAEAIQVDQTKADAYPGLSDAYVEQLDYASAE